METMRITPTALVALLGALSCACQAPVIDHGPVRVRPEDDDPIPTTGIESSDMLRVSEGIASYLAQKLDHPPMDRPWRVHMMRPVNRTSARIDPELISTDIIRRLERMPDERIDFYLSRAETLAEAFAGEQRSGIRSGDAAPPTLVTPDYVLEGTFRGHERNPRGGVSRWFRFAFQLYDLSGRVVGTEAIDVKKVEERPHAYR